MRNIKAFLVALLIFCITVPMFHLGIKKELPGYELSYGTWINEAKFASTDGLDKMLASSQSIPIFGSSELRHGQKSKFHANTIFKNADMEPVFIGQAGYQCLTHATTLGALGDNLKGRKVVLIVSEQWFKKKGVREDAFGAAFSEDNYIRFLENPTIRQETKEYVMARTERLTSSNEVMNERILRDNEWYGEKSEDALSNAQAKFHALYVKEKAQTRLLSESMLFGKGKNKSKEDTTTNVVSDEDWADLYRAAEKKGGKIAGGNEFGMCNSAYTHSYQEVVEKGSVKRPGYTTNSVEFDDLECFLKICKDEKITPLIVMLPFNGYWYDFANYDSSKREAIYQKVLDISEKYGAECADLSGNEYAQYYFEDNSHLALKGLVDLNEHIYRFYQEDENVAQKDQAK